MRRYTVSHLIITEEQFAAVAARRALRNPKKTPKVEVKFGLTEHKRSLGLDLHDLSVADRLTIGGRERYRAQAANVSVDYRPASWLTLSGSATRLVEPNAFLGVRTTATGAFGEGTVSTGLTMGADADVGAGFSLFGSATGSRTESADDAAALRVVGAYSTAFQAGAAKRRGLCASGWSAVAGRCAGSCCETIPASACPFCIVGGTAMSASSQRLFCPV